MELLRSQMLLSFLLFSLYKYNCDITNVSSYKVNILQCCNTDIACHAHMYLARGNGINQKA